MKITTAAVAVWLAFAQPVTPPPTPDAACCKQCNGTGMVWSGDGLARIHCPCPSTCPCAANRPKQDLTKLPPCKDGKCSVSR